MCNQLAYKLYSSKGKCAADKDASIYISVDFTNFAHTYTHTHTNSIDARDAELNGEWATAITSCGELW